MASDLFMDDFLFQETDGFGLPLLDFDPDGALLTPSELAMSQTHLQQTQHLPFPADDDKGPRHPTSPVSTDDGSTDAEVSTPPSAFAQQLPFSYSASSPAVRAPLLLDSSASTHSPLPSEQKLLASRTSHRNTNSNSRIPLMPTTPPTYASKPLQPSKTLPMPMPSAAPFAGSLPYAMPVALFQPLNVNQKRPLPQVLPGAPSPSVASSASPSTAPGAANGAATGASASADSDPNAKKSKREIRQMKNRESANKSRLRRKAQLSTLTTEVTELKKKEQELQTIIAGLRAENKSLLDQNTFLRSLVTNVKQEPTSSRSNQHVAAFASLPPPTEQSCVALNMLESGQKMDVDSEPQTQTADVDLTLLRPGKRRAVSSTLSAASLAVCASVFGITIFADYDGDAVASGNVRGVGRVLHEAPTACGMDGCSSEGPTSLVGFALTAVRSWWQFVSSSELVFGVLLNVLSFIAIVAVYQLWQAHSVGEWSWKCPGLSTRVQRDVEHHASVKPTSSSSTDEKKTRKRSALRDVRLRDQVFRTNSSVEDAFM